MTTFCRIVLTVVSCTIDPATPAPTPADAVAIFRASSPPFQVMPAIEPSQWYVGPSIAYDRDWPFTGSFVTPRADPTWAPTSRRLDGTSLWDPPMVYGLVPRVHGGWYGQSARVYQGTAGRPRSAVPDVRTAGGTRPLRAAEARGGEGGRGRAPGAHRR
jgi:hypothetical protein